MVKFLSITLLMLLLTVCFYTQKNEITKKPESKPEVLKQQVKIDKSKPSVYLEFERIGTGKPLYDGDSKERVWLKFVNNTQWSVFANEFVFGEDEEKIGFFYEVEREKRSVSNTKIPKGYSSGDSHSPESEIESGKSVSFSVPKNHLANGLKIRIDFFYDWENGTEMNKPFYSEPLHSVYFTSSQMQSLLNRN